MSDKIASTGRRIGAAVRRACWVASLALPAASFATTLPEVYELAVKNDAKFRSIQAETRANSTAIDQARAGFRPTLRFDLDVIETRNDVRRNENIFIGTGSQSYRTTSGTLSLVQPLFRKDVIARFEQAQAVVRQAEYTALAAQQDLMVRTTAAYLSVLAATDSVALARAEREAVGKVLELARERLRSGLGTITAQHDAAARFAITEARVLEAEHKLRDAQQALREITARYITEFQSLRPEFPLITPDPADPALWVKTALDQNLLLRARGAAVEVAQQEVERQRAGHYPSVNLLVSHNRKDAESSLVNGSFGPGTLVETTDLTVRLSVPIFEGGLTSAVTEEAVHRFHKAKEDLELERRSIERATRASFDATVSAVNLVKALRQAVVSQESALEVRQDGYKSGLFSLLQVLDAQRDLYLARRDYAQSRYDYLLYRLRLKLATGTLSETDLAEVASALR